MKRDSGQLPVDFLVGFTIFILSLITVANFVPSLLVGLQRTTGIDYDAVAYRTGVVLVEDPGQPAGELHLGVHPVVPPAHPEWDLQTLAEKEFVSRFGLAITRDTPNILSINKIERFFNTSFFNDTDYRNKMLFSTYQYGFNITLQNISPMKAGEYPNGLKRMIGQPYPAGYGYIRRYVVIKQNSDADINLSTFWIPQAFIATREDQVDLHYIAGDDPHQKFTIRLDKDILYNKGIDTPLKIDLQREPLSIRITNLSSCLNNTAYNLRTGQPDYIANSSAQWAQNTAPMYIAAGEFLPPITANLTAVDFGTPEIPTLWTNFIRNVNLTVDRDQPGGYGHVDWANPLGKIPVKDTIELYLPYLDTYFFNDGSTMVITFTFQNTIPHTLATGTYWYDYNPRNVTQPVLSTGMLEVGIW
jgi:hypothetical protein